MSLLELVNLHKTFEKGTVNENHVLRGLDLTIEDGDFISVIGGNGAGKSTLLNCIAGLIPIDQGAITLDNQSITKDSVEKRSKDISRVFQDPRMGTATNLTIEENMAIAHKRGNKRQALTLAMATLVRPKLLLLDEHTAALDPKTSDMVMELTQKVIEEQRLTALMITHNMEHAIAYGNRLVMLYHGKIVVDVKGEAKRNLTVAELMELFHKNSGQQLIDDALVLG
ncbi:TPA: ATP-binding cassette domain-containing protein [Streptococcus agalactiae]|nr:ATP-binding cassette domain-containing protein [Streptococcus agalactiae]